MISKLKGILVLALSVGLFLAPVADATTFKGTIHFKATYVSIGGSLSFNTADTASTAVYGTGSLIAIFPTKPILGGTFNNTGVGEVLVGTTACSFTGVFGEAEMGVKTSLIGSVTASDGPVGSTFFVGASESGCVSLTTGAFTSTETDTLFAGTGVYKGATGSSTYTSVGFTLAAPAAGFGFFQWARGNGKTTITLP
jgi:hypothetical protein